MSTLRRGPDVVIANGATDSTAVDLGEGVLCGLQFATMTSTAMTLHSADAIDGTFALVLLRSGAFSITMATDRYITLLSEETRGLRFIKLIAGSAEGAARTVKTYVRNIS